MKLSKFPTDWYLFLFRGSQFFYDQLVILEGRSNQSIECRHGLPTEVCAEIFASASPAFSYLLLIADRSFVSVRDTRFKLQSDELFGSRNQRTYYEQYPGPH